MFAIIIFHLHLHHHHHHSSFGFCFHNITTTGKREIIKGNIPLSQITAKIHRSPSPEGCD